MLNNYHYFLVLAEELNISNASKKLFITHQCLSSYLKKLEKSLGTTLFNRKPHLSLTPSGQILLESLRDIELIEYNLKSKIEYIKNEQAGIINFGITEGRYRILIPKLIKEYKSLYPNVQLQITSNASSMMKKKLFSNELDMFFAGSIDTNHHNLIYDTVMEEHLYLIISDNLLKEYFSDDYPQCKETFSKGVDLRKFESVPFVLNHKNFTSRIMLQNHLNKIRTDLRCITELSQPDLHHLLSEVDYAASFCLSMYIPRIKELNSINKTDSKLNIFPILNFDDTNTLSLIYLKDKIFPKYALDFIKLVKKLCTSYNSLI